MVYKIYLGNCNGSGADSGLEAIKDLRQAKKLWANNETIPISYVCEAGKKPESGFCDPVVADGKDYVYYWLASGEVSKIL